MKIEIKKELIEKIKKKIDGTNFTIESYVEYILKDVFDENIFTQEDAEKVKERLKALGYMD